MEYLNMDDLPEIQDTELESNVFFMTMKPFVGESKLSFKADLNLLSNYYLMTSELTDIETAIMDFRKEIEKSFQGFETEEYFSENGYMLKEDANNMRKKLMRQETLENILGEYLKPNQLSVDLKEVDENSYSLVNSYIASMVSPAATVKTSLAEINALDQAVQDIGSSE